MRLFREPQAWYDADEARNLDGYGDIYWWRSKSNGQGMVAVAQPLNSPTGRLELGRLLWTQYRRPIARAPANREEIVKFLGHPETRLQATTAQDWDELQTKLIDALSEEQIDALLMEELL